MCWHSKEFQGLVFCFSCHTYSPKQLIKKKFWKEKKIDFFSFNKCLFTSDLFKEFTLCAFGFVQKKVAAKSAKEYHSERGDLLYLDAAAPAQAEKKILKKQQSVKGSWRRVRLLVIGVSDAAITTSRRAVVGQSSVQLASSAHPPRFATLHCMAPWLAAKVFSKTLRCPISCESWEG